MVQYLAVTDTRHHSTDRYLYRTPTSLAQAEISASTSDRHSACANPGTPTAGGWTALELAPQFGGPARATTPRFTLAHPIPDPQPLPPSQAPFGGTLISRSIPSAAWHGPPLARERIPCEDLVFLREQLGSSEPSFQCPVFERLLRKEPRPVHRCRLVRLDDLFAVLKHLVDEHMDACCPICYHELLEVENLEIGHFKMGPAFFEKIQYAIAHIRWKHTKPWHCRVCDLRFGAKTNYNDHMKKNPAHKSREQTDLSGYYDAEIQSLDKRLGKCANKEALDDWILDCPVENRRNRAWPNDGASQAQSSPQEDGASPPTTLTAGLHSQPNQASGCAGSHWPMQSSPIYLHQHVSRQQRPSQVGGYAGSRPGPPVSVQHRPLNPRQLVGRQHPPQIDRYVGPHSPGPM